MKHTAFAIVATLALVLAALPASAASLAGVTLPDSAQVGGEKLVLNGLGLREKFFIDVYVAGLYLPGKQKSGTAILSADGPRHLEMHFVRDVTKEQICEAWNESLAGNTPKASAELKKNFVTLCEWMGNVGDGDQMAFTYLPGKGTSVSVKGAEKGTIAGKPFADALFASWIGDKPATGNLKKGLLGG